MSQTGQRPGLDSSTSGCIAQVQSSSVETPGVLPARPADRSRRLATKRATDPNMPPPRAAQAAARSEGSVAGDRVSGVFAGLRRPATIEGMEGFAPAELRKLRALKTPFGIQRFLDAMPYHLATTAWSPRTVLRERTAHCLEAAIFAAAALRAIGHRPLLADLEAEHDTDHVLAVFRERGLWGAVAKSNYAGLEYREPIHRTLRELALSYFPLYFNLRRERTLRTVSRPVDLRRFDARGWMISDRDVWYIPEYLLTIAHTPIVSPVVAKGLHRLEERTYKAGLVGHRWK